GRCRAAQAEARPGGPSAAYRPGGECGCRETTTPTPLPHLRFPRGPAEPPAPPLRTTLLHFPPPSTRQLVTSPCVEAKKGCSGRVVRGGGHHSDIARWSLFRHLIGGLEYRKISL